MMQDKLRKQLQVRVEYIKTLEKDFQNNLQVIEERQYEIEELSQQVRHLQQQNHILASNLNQLQEQSDLEIRIIRGQYQRALEEKQLEMEELAVMIETKLRKEMEIVNNKLNTQIKKLRKDITESEESYRRVMHQNTRQQQIIKDQKTQLLDLQSKLSLLTEQKNSYAQKMALHLQELDSVKDSQQAWEDTLKAKVKEAQLQKQKLEEELSEVKLSYKDKLKRQKEEFGKKLLQMAQQKERQIKETMIQQKEMKYRLEKYINQHKQLSVQLQLVKEENRRNENLISKYKENQMKSNFQKNQKQFEMMQKMFDQNARDLKSQIALLGDEKKSLKEELAQANTRREAAQKAVERLKVDLLNKSKQVDDLQKESKKQAKQQVQIHPKVHEAHTLNEQDRPLDIKKMDIIESAKFADNEYSKVYTDDLGPIDDKFFEQLSPKRGSPKNNKNVSFQSNLINREAQLMKKISELQLQNQEYKHLIKGLRDEAEGMRRICQQDKNKQIAVYRDKANIYWQKANDKEQQLVALRQQYTELKATLTETNAELKQLKEREYKLRQKQTEEFKIKQKLAKAEEDNRALEDQVKMLEEQRKMLQDVSAELRSQIHTLKDMINTNIEFQEQPFSQEDSEYNQTTPYQYQGYFQAFEEQRFDRQQQQRERQKPRQKIPKKLHDLVREKKSLSITGRQAVMAQKIADTRLEHIGTDSQKEVYQKIKVKNKTPPKVANYAELKQREKQRRTNLIQTPSQKEVFERLKSKNIVSPQKGPDRGVNYLQMRNQTNLQ